MKKRESLAAMILKNLAMSNIVGEFSGGKPSHSDQLQSCHRWKCTSLLAIGDNLHLTQADLNASYQIHVEPALRKG